MWTRLVFPLSLLAILACKANDTEKTASPTEVKPKNPANQKDEPTESKLPPPPTPIELAEDTGRHTGKLSWAWSGGDEGMQSIRGMANAPGKDLFAVGYSKPAEGPPENDAEIYLARISATGKTLWQRTLGGPGPDIALAATSDHAGNLYVAGSFSKTLTIGESSITSAGADDAFVAKFSPAGKMQWTVRLGGRDIDSAEAIALTSSGEVWVTGTFRASATFGEKELQSNGDSDIFLTKLDKDGVVVWAEGYGSNSADLGRALFVGNGDEITLTSEFSRTLSVQGKELVSKGRRDILIARFAKNGNLRWTSQFGNTLDDWAFSIGGDSQGAVTFVGAFEDKISFGDTLLKSRGQTDAMVVKLNAEGKPVWAKQFCHSGRDHATAVVVDKFGSSYVTGRFEGKCKIGDHLLESVGERDVFISKWNAKGTPLWSRRFGGEQTDSTRGIALWGSGVAVGGAFHLTAFIGGLGSRKAADKKANKELFTAKADPTALIPKADGYVLAFSN